MAVARDSEDDKTQEHSAALHPAALMLSAVAVKSTPPSGTTASAQVCRPAARIDALLAAIAEVDDGVFEATREILETPMLFQNWPSVE